MKNIRSLFILTLTAGLLAGCSYFSEEESAEVRHLPPAEIVDLSIKDLAGPQYADVQDAPRDGMTKLDIGAESAKAADGSVEVFDLDEAIGYAYVPSFEPARTADAMPGAVATAAPIAVGGGGSVQVFPLDDVMAENMAWPVADSGVVPASIETEKLVQSAVAEEATQTKVVNVPERRDQYVSMGAPGAGDLQIYFGHDSVGLNKSDKQKIKAFAAAFLAKGRGGLHVEGHASPESSIADSTQKSLVNLRISMERAYAVAKVLIENGVPQEIIQVDARGAAEPALAAGGKDIDAASRRVEITTTTNLIN